jgi:AcrR family transcriptional regulator
MMRAAAGVFGRRGYRLTQMEEIAKEAGISKATLYYYFKSKTHLFQYLLVNGIPADGASAPSPAESIARSDDDLLQLLKRELADRSRLKSISGFLNDEAPGQIDLEHEMGMILEEMWELMENWRVQIIILEKSAFEFPELASVYDKYARQAILGQLGEYLESRMRAGAIRPLGSVAVAARTILESMAIFGWKQHGDYFSPVRHSKAEALPELVAIFANGLKS